MRGPSVKQRDADRSTQFPAQRPGPHFHRAAWHEGDTVKERAHDLSRVGDARISPDDERIARDPLRTLRPRERLRLLADEGSLHVIRSEVTSERMAERALAGDGVIGGSLRIGGKPVFCFAQDASYAAGSLGAQHAD